MDPIEELKRSGRGRSKVWDDYKNHQKKMDEGTGKKGAVHYRGKKIEKVEPHETGPTDDLFHKIHSKKTDAP
jgi:hypothetical protein